MVRVLLNLQQYPVEQYDCTFFILRYAFQYNVSLLMYIGWRANALVLFFKFEFSCPWRIGPELQAATVCSGSREGGRANAAVCRLSRRGSWRQGEQCEEVITSYYCCCDMFRCVR